MKLVIRYICGLRGGRPRCNRHRYRAGAWWNALRGRVLRDRCTVSRVDRSCRLITVTKMARENATASSDQGDRNRVSEATHSRVMRDTTGRLNHRPHIEANNCVYGSGLCEKLSDTIVDRKFPEGRWARRQS